MGKFTACLRPLACLGVRKDTKQGQNQIIPSAKISKINPPGFQKPNSTHLSDIGLPDDSEISALHLQNVSATGLVGDQGSLNGHGARFESRGDIYIDSSPRPDLTSTSEAMDAPTAATLDSSKIDHGHDSDIVSALALGDISVSDVMGNDDKKKRLSPYIARRRGSDILSTLRLGHVSAAEAQGQEEKSPTGQDNKKPTPSPNIKRRWDPDMLSVLRLGDGSVAESMAQADKIATERHPDSDILSSLRLGDVSLSEAVGKSNKTSASDSDNELCPRSDIIPSLRLGHVSVSDVMGKEHEIADVSSEAEARHNDDILSALNLGDVSVAEVMGDENGMAGVGALSGSTLEVERWLEELNENKQSS